MTRDQKTLPTSCSMPSRRHAPSPDLLDDGVSPKPPGGNAGEHVVSEGLLSAMLDSRMSGSSMAETVGTRQQNSP
jgi:hypothetical protein